MRNWKVALATVAIVVGAVACAPQSPGTGGGSAIPAGCYGSPLEEAPDLRFNGAANTVDNLTVSLDIATFTLSGNGTCTGIPLEAPYAFTLVRADDELAAQGRCTTLGFDQGVGQLMDDYPGFPAQAWVCNPLVDA